MLSSSAALAAKDIGQCNTGHSPGVNNYITRSIVRKRKRVVLKRITVFEDPMPIAILHSILCESFVENFYTCTFI